MADLLIINPNTTGSITTLLQVHVSERVGASTGKFGAVHAVTARFGSPYISSEASYAVAAHSTLDAWAAWLAANPNTRLGAILVGCFGDPGSMALRDSAAVPVTGLAEAAFVEAAAFGRFAIVTGGERWKPILERLAHGLGFGDRLVGIHTVTPTGAELAADPEGALRLLATACNDIAKLTGADAVVLGGAGLAGMAARIQSQVQVPVIDSVAAGARQAALLCGQPGTTSSPGFDVPWVALSPELTALGSDRR
ncbi:aspartate/glutamate racemase family protein [soil metagenome]